ncbi:MAG: GAF domain-containing protein, partial [Bacteroidota bacterium]|nr:GAF domain-containing protein [Bacteroidota bacterium]
TKDRSNLKKIARQGLRKLTYYAKYAPENYQHKCILIKSQMALVDQNFNNARLLFDQAIREAEEQGFIHEEALAYELAGRAYHENGYPELAKYYLNYAFNLYREWGAIAKLDHLLHNYPKYFTAVSGMKNESTSIQTSFTSTFSLENEALDMKSLLKASTSISGEVELPQLIRKLMAVLTENAGAQKGVLIMQTEGQLFVEAVYDANNGTTELLKHIPLEGHEEVPSSLIKYVQRSGKDLVIHSYGSFSGGDRDTYYQQTKPESSLGLPINNQGKFLGVIYLENRLTRNAFTRERIDFLAMLSSQIAVSLENALLYQSLEQKVAERTEELAREKQVSDDLLFNILPREVAEELKVTGTTQPRHYEAVTVLFTDFVGFTRTAQTMTAEELVSNIDRYFRKFDEIIAQHKLEKIKTIGDAYMCAGGLPVPNTTHALDVIHAARDIIRYTRESRHEHSGMAHLDIRIGVHTGPLVAGVVGSRKFAYDIWGNTVNQASRLESSSEPGQINISETTYNLIKDTISCTYRGKLDVKGIGEVPMYFVDQ